VTEPALTREDLTKRIARLARVSHEDIRGDADLTSAGLSSLDILLLVNEWRVRGLPVTYHELVATPTLDAWWARIAHLLRANPYLAA
jgi:bifunctional isochorismate lyase/aryl carrier protein